MLVSQTAQSGRLQPDRKRQADEDPSYVFLDSFEYRTSKRFKIEPPDQPYSSLYDTCGELSQETYCSEGESRMDDDTCNMRSIMQPPDEDAIADMATMDTSLCEPSSPLKSKHKGRTMDDYCTSSMGKSPGRRRQSSLLSSISWSSDGDPGNNHRHTPNSAVHGKNCHWDGSRKVHFQVDAPGNMENNENNNNINTALSTVEGEEELVMRTDPQCSGCRRVHDYNSAHMILTNCKFCSKLFCNSASCVCTCDSCGGTFCHMNCSTINYCATFEKTLCLDCNRNY